MDYKDLQAGQTEENFWFKGKNGLISVLMKKVCGDNANLKILNIGAGTGSDLKILNRFGTVHVIDVNEEALSIIDSDLYYEKKIADACNLPYADNFFDIVVSFDVFEHIEDDKRAASEVYRVLKDKGSLVFTVPAFQCLFSSHDSALEHQRRYGKKKLRELLCDFQSVRIFFWNSLLFFPIAALRLLRARSKPSIDKIVLPAWLNKLFFFVLSFDNVLIERGVSMPFGLSLVGYCLKKDMQIPSLRDGMEFR